MEVLTPHRKRELLAASHERLDRFEDERERVLADLHNIDCKIEWERANLEQLRRN